jgi:hypothetical protein
MRGFEYMVLKRSFRPRRNDEQGGLLILLNEKFHNTVYSFH